VWAEFFHADGRADVAKQTVAFSDFANAPKKVDGTAMIELESYTFK
jgi:hypothetical protein